MYFHTKYAVTVGIIEVPDDLARESAGYLYVGPDDGRMPLQVGRNDWFRTPEEAQVRARKLVEAKRASVQTQLKNLDALLASGVPSIQFPRPEEAQ